MTDESALPRGRGLARWIIVVIVVVVAVALVAGGWFAATVFTSPEQRAAAAAAPSPAPILVQVESGSLVDTRTLSGTVRPTDSFDAVLGVVAGAGRSIVTSVSVTKGQPVSVGSVVATVNGQPVFATQSAFPFYRDMGVGDHGVDVRALQESLVAVGLLGSADGQFGSATATAVQELFTRAGFDVPLRAAAPVSTSDPTPSVAGGAVSDGGTVPDGGAVPDSGAKTAVAPAPVVYFPIASGLTVPALPAVVTSAPAVGTEVSSGATFGFAAQSLAVFATLPTSLPEGLEPGTTVVVSGAGLDNVAATAHGTITSTDTSLQQDPSDTGDADSGAGDTAAQPFGGTDGATSAQTEVRFDLDGDAILKPEQAGQSVTVTVTVRQIAEDALIVPVTAVDEADSTHGHVLVVTSGSATERVTVTIVGVVDGRVALKPGETLKVGDQVRVR